MRLACGRLGAQLHTAAAAVSSQRALQLPTARKHDFAPKRRSLNTSSSATTMSAAGSAAGLAEPGKVRFCAASATVPLTLQQQSSLLQPTPIASQTQHTPKPTHQVKIALCQLSVSADKPANIAAATAAIHAAAAAGARLVVLPEMWNCPYSNDSFPTYAEDFDRSTAGDAPSYSALAGAAAAAGVTVVGGSVPERAGGRLYNTCCVFGPDGQLLAKHRCAAVRGPNSCDRSA